VPDSQEPAHSPKPYVVIIKRYWSRLFETSVAWMLNDLAFYGARPAGACAITLPKAGCPLHRSLAGSASDLDGARGSFMCRQQALRQPVH
jgi:hypothetical protein